MAAQWGLAIPCLPGLDLEGTAMTIIDQLLSVPQSSLRAIKVLMHQALGRSRADQLSLERTLQLDLLRERVQAFTAGSTDRSPSGSTPTGPTGAP